MKICKNNSRILVFSVALIFLLSFYVSESAFAYYSSFSSKKPIHRIYFTFSCDAGPIQHISIRVYQIDTRNGFDKTINSDLGNTAKIALNLPDGKYIVMATSRTRANSILLEGQIIFAVNGKDHLLHLKMKPLEGMA
jgi:hypothetical protein